MQDSPYSSTEAPVVTRFAPSPTGYLHIGGARTALFNWLFARRHGGQFLLRIEDTDQERSTPEATQAILDGLAWLGLDYDGEAYHQHAQAERHAEVAHQMLASGEAYKCFATQDEITAFREQAKAEGRSTLFLSPWRDVDPADHPNAPYVVRLRAPRDGATVIKDQVQGDVTIQNAQLDDMVLLRSDGSPVYMLAVVVDDFDMGVTHVIRGDDHLNNAARQLQIYRAMGWAEPHWAHIPLIHGEDGKKLSKRHAALGLHEYADLGYTAAAMRNYLARLGWSHGDDEVFNDDQAREWFDLSGIGKAPARLDLKKLSNISGHHFRMAEDEALVEEYERFRKGIGAAALTEQQRADLTHAMPILKQRAKTFFDVTENASFLLVQRPVEIDEKAKSAWDSASQQLLKELTPHLQSATWSREELENCVKAFAEISGMGFGKIAAPLRIALCGRKVSPSVIDMMVILGREESLARIDDMIKGPSDF